MLYKLEIILEVDELHEVDGFIRQIHRLCDSVYDFWEGNSSGYMSPEETKEFFIDSELDES